MPIIIDKIDYTYEIGTGFEKHAIRNLSCVIKDGEYIDLCHLQPQTSGAGEIFG